MGAGFRVSYAWETTSYSSFIERTFPCSPKWPSLDILLPQIVSARMTSVFHCNWLLCSLFLLSVDVIKEHDLMSHSCVELRELTLVGDC